MSKKSKASKKQKKLYIAALAALLGIAAFCMMFLDGVVVADSDEWTYTGMQIAFGYSTTVVVEIKWLSFNILALLAFALPLAGGLVCAAMYKSNLGALVGCILFAAGAVLCFIMPVLFPMGITSETLRSVAEAEGAIGLAIGSIMGGAISALGALCCLAKAAVK